MSTFKKLFKEKNWRLFKKGDCIIATRFLDSLNKDLVKPHRYVRHVKIITKVDMKLLRYEYEMVNDFGEVQSGNVIYFKEAKTHVKVNKELRCYFKIMRL